MTQSAVSSEGGGGIGGFFIRMWSFIHVFAIAFKYSLVETFSRHRKVNLQVMPKRTGDTAVITGGARGIGAEVVKQLMILDIHVIIGCRNPSAGVQLIDKLRKQGIQSGSAEVLPLDLNSFASVKNFACSLLDRNLPINILINNAGIMFTTYQITEDGFESQFQTNYLSHFFLTSLLIPLLISGGSPYRASRVVNVSSIANYGGKINFEDLNMHKMYDKHMAYMSSKLMQVASAKDLNSRMKADGSPVGVYSVHPGVVNTDLYDGLWYIEVFSCIIKRFFRSPEEGADGVVYVAVSPEIDTDGGEFFMNCRKQSPNPMARDPAILQRLWSVSQSLVGIKSAYHKEAVEIVVMT